MKFSVVIPNITKKQDKFYLLKSCIESFRLYHGLNNEVIVVDDGSNKEFMPMIKMLCEANNVILIEKEKNEGFSKTVNQGIRSSTGDVVFLLNNDVVFQQEILSEIEQSFLLDKEIGIVGCLLFYPNGTIQHGGIARMGFQFTHLGWHKTVSSVPDILNSKYLIGVTGAAFAMKREMINEVGYFDEDFFIACEDTQYCIRAWQKGWKVFYNPKAKAIHIEGGTRGSTDQQKLSQSIDTRNWYLAELKTNDKFQKWIRAVNLQEIDRRVNESNLYIKQSLRSESIISTPSKDLSASRGIVHSDSQHVEVIKKESSEVLLNPDIKKSTKIIGVRRTGAFGDVLMATPVIRELKKRYPNLDIWVSTVTPDAVKENPYVSNIVSSIQSLKQVTDVIYDLDLAYENNPKMHVTDAYSKVVFGHFISDKRIDLTSNQLDFESAFPFIHGSVNFERDKVVVLHMATSWANRTWPKQHWSHLVKSLSTRGYKILIVGRGSDMRADMISGVINLVDRLSIRQVREIIKKSHVFVGMDSGLFHVAQSTDTPTVGLFTVANPEFRLTRIKDTYCLVPSVPCRFCLHEEKPPVTFVGCKINTMQCLNEITPVNVLKTIDDILRKKHG